MAEVTEGAETPRKVTWHSVELVLPVKLPLAVAFDLAEADELTQTTLMRVTKSILGTGQYRAVRNQIADEGIPMEDGEDVLVDLFQVVLGHYGISVGESSASAPS